MVVVDPDEVPCRREPPKKVEALVALFRLPDHGDQINATTNGPHTRV